LNSNLDDPAYLKVLKHAFDYLVSSMMRRRKLWRCSRRGGETHERRNRRKLQDLLDKKANDEEVDEDRMYCLELFARQHLGEELTEDELMDLEDFEKEETAAAAKAKAQSETVEKEMSDDPNASAGARANELPDKAEKRDRDSSSSSSSESGSESDRVEGSAKHLKKINQPIMEHASNGDSLGSGELFDAPNLSSLQTAARSTSHRCANAALYEQHQKRGFNAQSQSLLYGSRCPPPMNQPIDRNDEKPCPTCSFEVFGVPCQICLLQGQC
jgi:hypothetical protein